jgi:predicted alpha/beta-fold hydrolase
MSFFLIFLLVIFVFLILFLLYRTFHSDLPHIYVNPTGHMYAIVDQMPILNTPYTVTPWLFNSHLQTLWGMRYRKSPQNYRREIYTFSDGGTSALDFFDPESMDHPPALLIIHTMAGGTREPCSSNLAEAARRAGFLAFVWNNRGCSGVGFTSRRFYNACKIDDLQEVVAFVRQKYQPSFFFIHGFSLGSYSAIRYAALDGGVDAVSGCSHTYNGNVAGRCMHKAVQSRLYLPVMMAKLKNIVRKNRFVDVPTALKARTLEEFDDRFTRIEEKVDDMTEYWNEASIHRNIPSLKIRALLLGSDNDPFTDASLQPRAEAEKSDWLAFVSFPEGGHVSFPRGFGPDGSIIEQVFLQYFTAVMNDKK